MGESGPPRLADNRGSCRPRSVYDGPDVPVNRPMASVHRQIRTLGLPERGPAACPAKAADLPIIRGTPGGCCQPRAMTADVPGWASCRLPLHQSTGQPALPVRPVPAGGPAVLVLLVVDKKVATLHIGGPHGRRASVTVHERRRLKRARRLPHMPSPTGRHARLRAERAPARCACGRRGRGRSKSKRLRRGPGSSTRRPCPSACRRGGS